MKVKLSGLKISHIAAGLPKKKISVFDYADIFGERKIKKIADSTGVEFLHASEENLCASDYGEILAQYLMKETGLAPQDFDGIVFISQTPDYIMPATSITLQDRLHLPITSVAFDINYGCNGYIYGLYQAGMLIATKSCRRVLIFTGDTKRRLLAEDDRSTQLIMGDGFSVTVMERGTDEICFNIYSDGSGAADGIVQAGSFRCPKIFDEHSDRYRLNFLHMNGVKMMDFVTSRVPDLILETLEYADLKISDIGVFALHQVNKLFLVDIAEKLNISLERLPITLQNSGNTGSASIPLMLSKEHKNLAGKNFLEKVLLCSFGVGLSWGAATANLSETKIFDTQKI